MNLEQWRLKQKSSWGRVMTCNEAARILGVQEDVFYRWRTGERFPAARKWPGIFQGLGVGSIESERRRAIAVAQRVLWRSWQPENMTPPGWMRHKEDPPGWDKLMAMIGGGK